MAVRSNSEVVVAQALTKTSLRLIGAETPAERARRHEEAARDVAEANRSAAEMSAGDARAIFAVRVSEQLVGGRAAMLTPESRRRLVDLGQRMGLRAFDANLVIAIVQDGARRGETPDDAIEDSPLRLIPMKARDWNWSQIVWPLIAASAMALGALLALAAWIAGD